MEHIDVLAKKLWDYHHVNHELKPADIIFVLCSHDLRVADYAVELYKQGFASLLIFSGGIAHKGDLIETPWEDAEAQVFATRAMVLNVPEKNIIIETKATNCGENVLFTEKILKEKHIVFDTIIAVQKPYMGRRIFATLKKHWPDKKIMVTSPIINFDLYPNQEISKDDVINLMVGDLQRIKEYAKKGFQIEQKIPEDVWEAYNLLIQYGYIKHLVL